MRGERAHEWRGTHEEPTLVTTAPLVRPEPARSATRHRLATWLSRLPTGARALGAALLLLATAELGVIARYGHGEVSQTPALAWSVLAPLYAAAAAVLLRAIGRLTHRVARLLGGTGDRNTSVQVLLLLAAMVALPAAAAALLWESGSTAATIVEIILSVTALIGAVRVIAYLENIGQVRATLAALLPVALLVAIVILLIALHSALLPLLPADWRIR